MNFRIAVLGLLLVTPVALAQKYATEKRASERAVMLQDLERGKQMKGTHDEYQHLPRVFATAIVNSSETPEQAIARTEKGAQLVERKGKLVLYRSSQTRLAAVGRAGTASIFPTVVNTRTGTLGVLTGTVIVKPKDMSEADAIASSHGLAKSKAYPKLGTVFYVASPGVDIADVSAALQNDPRVDSAYPEIIEHVRAPK